jgi:peptide/nickel transport system substrate-binding protein
MQRNARGETPLLTALVALSVIYVGSAHAQAPSRGGILTHVIESEPDTYDCLATTSAQSLQSLAPHYSMLLKFDIANYPRIVGDVADSWQQSSDGLAYTFKLHDGVRFHDGSVLASEDVKATYDRLRNPPPGTVSVRKNQYSSIEAIETPDRATVVFKLSQPDPGLLSSFASPWNCLYSSKKLAEDPKFYEKNIMGTGPFVFVEYVRGAHWLTKRFDQYFRDGHPYLDGTRGIYLRGAGVINALSGGQVDAAIYLLSPPDVQRIKQDRGDRTVFQEGTLNTLSFMTINTRKQPFDDVRVRRAINLAIDRRQGEAALSRLTVLKGYGLYQRPGTEWAVSPDELSRLPGFGADVAASRTEAKRLLAEAGVHDLQIKLLNRPQRHPWEPLGIFVIDQLRQIGIQVENFPLETPQYFAQLQSGNFDIALDFNNTTTDDPTEVLAKHVPGSAINYNGAKDQTLIDLFKRQSHEIDQKGRREAVLQFQEHLADQAYSISLFWSYRSVALPATMQGWTIPPSTAMNLDFGDVWLKP